MASKIFNKFKEPKFAEFSRKDLVVDIKNGDLYYKSNLGVHKVPSEISTTTFGTTPATSSLTGNTFKNTGQRDGNSSITGSLTLVGNLSASGNLFANLTNSSQTKIVFYNSTTGELTEADTTKILGSGILSSSAQIATAISGASSIATTTFKSTGQRTGNASITGSLTVTGTLTAQEFHTEFISSSIIFTSGSTKFGDTLDDNHEMTGSLKLTGSQELAGNLTISSIGQLRLGGTDDFKIFQDGANSQIINRSSGDLIISSQVTNSDLMLKNVAGGGTTNYIVLDGGEEKSIFYRPTRHRDNVTASWNW